MFYIEIISLFSENVNEPTCGGGVVSDYVFGPYAIDCVITACHSVLGRNS